MSRRHAWLTFTAGGPPLARTLATDPAAWQLRLTALQGRWYDVDAPPQVATVFVLQWLLQVPAHTAAHAAAAGPWRADLGGLTFDLGPALVPSTVRLDHAPAGCRRARRAPRPCRARLPRGRRPAGRGLPGPGAAGAARPVLPRRRHVVGGPARGRVRHRAAAAGRAGPRVVLPDLRAARLRRVRRLPPAAPGELTQGRSAIRSPSRSTRSSTSSYISWCSESGCRAPCSTSSQVRGAATQGSSRPRIE